MNGFSEARIGLLEEHAQAYSASLVVDAVYTLWGNTSTPDQVLLNVIALHGLSLDVNIANIKSNKPPCVFSHLWQKPLLAIMLSYERL